MTNATTAIAHHGGTPSSAPRVDVGIPTSGRPTFLVEAIESIREQSMTSWRLVISEDGPSSPETEAVAARYLADPRISYRSTGERVGAARNMTTLIQDGTAPYVGLLHDDDLWDPGFLARRVAFLDEHPECGFVFSRERRIDPGGRLLGQSPSVVASGAHSCEEFVPLYARDNFVDTASVLVRRDAYDAVGGRFDERFSRLYDYEMWLRIALAFPVGFLDVADVAWRRHGQQSSFARDRRGDYELFFRHLHTLLAEQWPQFEPSPAEHDRRLADWLLRDSLNALEQGDRQSARSYLGQALAAHPRSALDRRVPALALGLLLGHSGRKAVTRMRARVNRPRAMPGGT